MRKYSGLLFLICFFVILLGCKQGGSKSSDDPATDTAKNNSNKETLDSRQLLVVTTNGWDVTEGKFFCYEKKNDKWVLQFSGPAVVGINGMGVGVGISKFEMPDAPVKKEGDLKAPAGIFKINEAFGYAEKTEVDRWIKVPYTKATSDLLCIDDANSSNYNKIVDAGSTTKDWSSGEVMERKDNLYKWGLFVEHNYPDPAKGCGSCIFIHIWKNANRGTEGCTAMTEDDIVKIMKWVDASEKPLLVQFPVNEYEKVSGKIDLPKL